MAVQHEINEILETIRKELPRRAQGSYEDAVKKAMRQGKRSQKHIARGMLQHNPLLRREWNKQQEEEGALAIFMLVIGLIGGAAIMYLFDPDRGARRRAAFQVEVRRATENATEAVEGTVERVREEVSKVTGDAEDKVEAIGDDAKAAVNNAVSSVKNTAAKVGDQVEDSANNAGDTVEDAAKQAKDNASKAADKVSNAVEDAAKQARSTANNLGDKASNAIDDVAKKAKDAADNLQKPAGPTGN